MSRTGLYLVAQARYIFWVAILGVATAALAQDVAPLPPALSSAAAPAAAAGGASSGANGALDLNMNLEQLTKQDVVVATALSTPVTTAERQPSTVGRTPAAVFVITPEMIKRSGARNLPDVLRMAPGVDVARINAYTWAISIRGFNGRFSNKVLVQIDGRVVYNGSFGGVYWVQQDVVLEDIDRIEVVRGVGTTMWGSNAVNGVINVLTKKSSDTQGFLAQSGGGNQGERDFNTLRYGGGNGKGLSWRVWGQQSDSAAGWTDSGANDAYHTQQGGFRLDDVPSADEHFKLQGSILSGFGGQQSVLSIPTAPYSAVQNNTNAFPAGNLLFQYDRTLDKDTSWQILGYYDHYDYNSPSELNDARDTYDLDFQYQFNPWDGHQVVAGANYRNSTDVVKGTFVASFFPASSDTQWGGVFAQDTMLLEKDRWYFIAGLRLEQNTLGGFQPEPTLRLLFLPSERQSLWMAVSRAARNPTLKDTDLEANVHIAPANVPIFLSTLGNPDIQAENLVSFEIGYRAAPTDQFSWDIAAYINDYDKLAGQGPLGAPVLVAPGLVFFPTVTENNCRAVSCGFEATANYKLNNCWRWFASYSLFEVHADGSDPLTVAQIEGSSPHNQVYLKSSWDLRSDVQLDLIGRYVDRLTALEIPQYFEVDSRIGWQMTKTLEVSFVGQNLMNSHHLEFIDTVSPMVATQVGRSWYGMLTWRF